jgi:hypothetical protein
MVGGISREDGVELDRLRDVGRFEVVNDGRPVGFTWFPVSDVVVKFDAASDEDLAS